MAEVLMLTVMSWNMNRRHDAWHQLQRLIEQHGVSAALVQEATQPATLPAGVRSFPEPAADHRWRISVPRYYRDGAVKKETRRHFASAIVSPSDVSLRERQAKALHDAADGELAASQPGQFAVADRPLADGRL